MQSHSMDSSGGAGKNPPKSNAAQRDDEVFDIVNARDEAVGRATRREVHAKGLWHRATHVVVEDERGRVFLQKRSMAKDTAPGRWDSACSGHVDSGETYEAAAVRELREEIGIDVRALGFGGKGHANDIGSADALETLFTLTPCEENGWEFIRIFRLRARGPFVFALNPAEIERGEWWEPEALSRALVEKPGEFTNALRMVWRKLKLKLEA